MARRRAPPRLYLDPKRQQWIIRDGEVYIRTGLASADRDRAEAVLEKYHRRGIPMEPPSRGYLLGRLHSAKERGIQSGKGFDLNIEDLYDLGNQQRWKCALTQLPFDYRGKPGGNPYALSLDRIDCALGYTRENVRMILFALNMGLNAWGERDYAVIAQAYLDTLRGGRIGAEAAPLKLPIASDLPFTMPRKRPLPARISMWDALDELTSPPLGTGGVL